MPRRKTPADKMTPPAGLTPAQRFFWDHAGWGYMPGAETPEHGRAAGARKLAAAETWLSEQAGHTVRWVPDTFGGEPGEWACVVRLDPARSESLCGIDFEGDGEPWGKPYARVVAAELALQLMPD